MRGSRERLAKESKTLVGQRLGQHAAVSLYEVISKPIFPGIERSRCHQRGLARKSLRLPHNETGLLKSRAAKVLSPIEARSLGGEISLRPCIVGLLDVFIIRQAAMNLGNGVLQFHDASRAGIRVRKSGELEHGRNMRLILAANPAHVLGIGKIVFAVTQF